MVQPPSSSGDSLLGPFSPKKAVTLATKTKVFDSLVVSKMLCNVHTWSGLHANDLSTWTNHLKGPIGVLLKGLLKPGVKY